MLLKGDKVKGLLVGLFFSSIIIGVSFLLRFPMIQKAAIPIILMYGLIGFLIDSWMLKKFSRSHIPTKKESFGALIGALLTFPFGGLVGVLIGDFLGSKIGTIIGGIFGQEYFGRSAGRLSGMLIGVILITLLISFAGLKTAQAFSKENNAA